MKNLKKFNGKIAAFLLMALLPNFVFGASENGFEKAVNELYKWMTGGIILPALTLVIGGVFIYWYRNIDRFKEVAWNGVSIILIVSGILAAPTIAKWLIEVAK